ncbi:MAG: major capsid protein [Pseudomonadota bacterium]|nr:major capsid protein [Pseudomonadota bacterium]
MSNETMSPGQQGLGLNPILTTVAQGYENAEFVGPALFPRIPVATTGGQILQFGKESFKLYNARRAPGGPTKRLNVGYAGLPFALVQDSLEAVVPRENQREAMAVAGVDVAAIHVETVMRALTLGLECEQAGLARDASKYAVGSKVTMTGSAKWSDPSSDPLADVADAREVVRTRIGQYPNTLVLGPKVMAALKRHPKVVERIKYTQFAAVSEQMLAELFEVATVKVAKGVFAGDDDVFADIWGNDAILAFVPKAGSLYVPSYGYTYTLNGNPLVENAYWDQNAKANVYGVTYERAPVITSADSAFLFQNAV